MGSVPRPLPFSTGVKPIGSFFERLSAIEVAGGVTQNIDVIGGGTSGCEVAMSLAGKALRQGLSWKICLFESSNSILPGQAPMLKSRVQEQLRKYKIDVYLGNPFKATVGRTVVNCTPARAPEWLAQTGLKTDEQGYVIHDSSLLTSDPSVFACGDMAINPQEPTVRAGVYAVRQAPILKKNLRANLNSESYAQFHPQRNFLSLMVDGEGGAFGSKGSMYLGHSPFFLWIKDRIDRKFMNKISSS